MPSGYFSPPSNTLDPHLFDGNKIREGVRRHILYALGSSLQKAGLKDPGLWLKVWLTGSGISYQWNADRGNGDLDVQIGMDHTKFIASNPEWDGVGVYELSSMVNRYMRETLWPKLAHAVFNGKEYEVTFYWNHDVETDIINILPYAAYDLQNDEWITHPPSLPADPRALYPPEWFSITDEDTKAAQELLQSHTKATEGLAQSEPGSAGYINALAYKNWAVSQAQSLYDDIHKNRKLAFSPHGQGYGDYHNFRWQRAKETGTREMLKSIIGPKRHEDIMSAEEALQQAITWRMGNRFSG